MATATPYTGEPWNGLTVTDIEGSTGKTFYNVSIADVNSSSFGDQEPWEGEAGSAFTLRFEWSSSSGNTSDTKADTATIVFRDVATGQDIGTTQWNVAVDKVSSGLATRLCHFDSDPLSGVLDAAREGKVYMHLYLERLNIDGTKRWQASSNGFIGGSSPRSFKYARGELNATPVAPPPPPPPPSGVTVNIGDVTVTEGNVEAALDLFLSAIVAQDVKVSYTTADGSAVADSDYTAKSSFRLIPAGETRSSSLPHVSVLEDLAVEGTEEFFVDITIVSGPPEVTVGKSQGVVTITDNDALPPPPLPSLGKFMAGFRQGNFSDIGKIEADLGKKLPCMRVFNSSWKLPGSDVNASVAEGKLVLFSVKPPSGGWGQVAYRSVSSPTILEMGQALKAYGKEIIFIFHHEPHDDASDLKGGSSGTSKEYRDAVRKIHDVWTGRGILAKEGGNVWMGYVAGDGGNWSLKPLSGGTDPCYAGGDVVDVLCHDSYNWYVWHNSSWKSFEQKWSGYARLARKQGKVLVAGETGSHPSSGGNSRNQWFRDAATWLKTGIVDNVDPVNKWFKGFCYFNRVGPEAGSHDWRFIDVDSSGSVFQVDGGRAGWIEAFVNDSFFSPIPFSLK